MTIFGLRAVIFLHCLGLPPHLDGHPPQNTVSITDTPLVCSRFLWVLIASAL